MSKKNVIFIVFIVLVISIGIGMMIIKKTNKVAEDTDTYSSNVGYNIPEQKEIVETIENVTAHGIVELNSNGYIYTFNGQHFGELGIEMEEYDSVNIENKNQECIDYYTSEKYDTNYIELGDIIFCTGNIVKYSDGKRNFDTKDSPIIVLKAKDFNNMQKDAISNKIDATITTFNYSESEKQIYLKYNISDKGYELPFVLKFNITDDVEIIGNLLGKEVKVQYKDTNKPIDELELKTIETIEE